MKLPLARKCAYVGADVGFFMNFAILWTIFASAVQHE